jgi:glycosyltransferase involved in cell wall biosynthesis
MPERRILAVIQSPVFGGSHNRTVAIEPYLRAAGWRTMVVLPDETGDAAARLRSGGIEVVTMPLHRLRATKDPRIHAGLAWSLPWEVHRLTRLVRARKIDLVRVVGIVHPHGGLAGRRAGAAVVWEATDLSAPAPLRRLAMPFVARLADGMLFNGQTLLEEHRRAASLPMPHAAYYPPVDLSRFAPDPERRAAARTELGIGPDEILVGAIANLKPDKGLQYLVRAAAIVRRAAPRVRFLVVGERHHNHAAYAQALLDEAAEAGLDGRAFRFAGPEDDLGRIYNALDIKAISSVTEGTTTTALEAMASGVPVVATDVGGVHEVVTAGVTGMLIPARDPERLAAALLGLVHDPAARARLGAEGRLQAERRFDARVSADVHLKLFEQALEHRDRRLGRERKMPT